MLTSVPILLSAVRLVAGPVYLVLGAVPASRLEMSLLFAAALTDVVDGWLARWAGASSAIGAGLDTTADKVFVLAILLKLTLAGRLPAVAFYVILAQFCILGVEGSIYVFKFGAVPVPDLVAKGGALLAFVTAVAGVSLASGTPLLVLSVLTIVANMIHLVTAFIRITADRPTAI